jgi:hypothetical protein
MPLAHKNSIPRTNGGQKSFGAADPSQALVLPKDAPLDAAKRFLADRYTRADARLLHYHRGAFYSWTETHYRELRPETLQLNFTSSSLPSLP